MLPNVCEYHPEDYDRDYSFRVYKDETEIYSIKVYDQTLIKWDDFYELVTAANLAQSYKNDILVLQSDILELTSELNRFKDHRSKGGFVTKEQYNALLNMYHDATGGDSDESAKLSAKYEGEDE